MSADRYVEALSAIPAGETRTFGEIARLAERPSGARAAGRAIADVPMEDARPWHRAVRADGGLAPDEPRARVQVERLREDGARPREGEAIDAWLERRGALAVGAWSTRVLFERKDPRIGALDPLAVEAFATLAAGRERGFGARPRARSGSRAISAEKHVDHPALDALERALCAIDWGAARERLWDEGALVLTDLCGEPECTYLRALFDERGRHERSVEMAPRGFGIGTYRYLREPPPPLVARLRERLYAGLAPLASRHPRCGDVPPTIDDFHERCVRAGQARGACIVLRYAKGGVNHAHRDIYGKVAFPYQAVLVASARDVDFEGGEFLLRERVQGDAWNERAFALDRGDLCVFPSRSRALVQRSRALVGRSRAVESRAPAVGEAGRVRWIDVEHGMRAVLSGERFALGVVFHLAE